MKQEIFLKKVETTKEQNVGIKWFNTEFYPQRKTCRSVRYEDGVLPRLREREITLFTPWGPRYSWESRGAIIKEDDKEVEALNFLKALIDELRQNMPDKIFRWVFLGADLYGTRINNLPVEAVKDYFCSLSEWLSQVLPTAEFWLWSQLGSNAEEYRQEIRTNFNNFISNDILLRANKTAQAMGRNSSAKEYLIERLTEAVFIEKTLKPIKISCVARNKDDVIDYQLPRLYFLPERLHAPWL